MTQILTPHTQRVDIRCEGKTVLVLLNGRAIMSMPWQAALEIAKGITAKAREAEEIEKSDQVISDQALMLATGAPFALTANKDIMEEAVKEARYDKHLKGFGDIKLKPTVGRPSIRHT